MIQDLINHTVFIRSLILVLVLLLVSSYFVKNFLLAIFPFALFRFILIPGIIVHEMSHAVGCLLTGAEVVSINVFGKEGGEVKHGEPYLKFLGPSIISMAPIVGSLLMFYFWSILVRTPFQGAGNSVGFISAADAFISHLGQINWFSWEIWLYLYGCMNLIIAISPSKQDFTNCKWELLFIFSVIFLMEYFQLFSGKNISDRVYQFFIPYILIAFFFLLLVTPIYLLRKKSAKTSE